MQMKNLCQPLPTQTLEGENKTKTSPPNSQVNEDNLPVVIGRLGHAGPDRPTVTFYGHYDVQPANEVDWRTNPFELNSVNEYLYGRGTSDNKVGSGHHTSA